MARTMTHPATRTRTGSWSELLDSFPLDLQQVHLLTRRNLQPGRRAVDIARPLKRRPAEGDLEKTAGRNDVAGAESEMGDRHDGFLGDVGWALPTEGKIRNPNWLPETNSVGIGLDN